MSDRDCGTKFELCGNCIRCLRHQRDFARERLRDAASDLADLTDQKENVSALQLHVQTLREAWTTSSREAVQLMRERDEALRERDEARAEVERLRRERDEALVESAQRALSVIALDRDEARAEVERLRAEVDAAREALGLAWCSDGSPLADGIRRKTHALESLIQ